MNAGQKKRQKKKQAKLAAAAANAAAKDAVIAEIASTTPASDTPAPEATPRLKRFSSWTIRNPELAIAVLFYCIGGATFLFALTWGAYFLLFGNHYLSTSGWIEVFQTVFFPLLVSWVGVYLSITSENRKHHQTRVMVVFAAIYIGWIIFMAWRGHYQETETTKRENKALCDKADGDVRLMETSRQAYQIAFQEVIREARRDPSPFPVLPNLSHDLTPEQAQAQEDKIIKESALGKGYFKVHDQQIAWFLEVAPDLEQLSRDMNEKMGVKDGPETELERDIEIAKGNPLFFSPNFTLLSIEEYMHSLSAKLCPVNNK